MTIRTVVMRPSGFLPMVMSVLALFVVFLRLAMWGAGPEAMHAGRPDEGPAAHIWQILITCQIPILVYFSVKWLRTDLLGTLSVLGLQLLAILAAMAPVFLLHL